jgi:hypothetical protein
LRYGYFFLFLHKIVLLTILYYFFIFIIYNI